MYFINGSMEAILDRLSGIQDLRVISRTSVEQYRNNLKPVREIARELHVSYILEGSGLKHGDQIRLTLQLIDARHDRQIWSDSYTLKEEEVFDLYSDVAQRVASEIEVIITPEEQELMEKIPTSNTTAFDLYQKAVELGQTEGVFGREKALELLDYALEYDSAFALAYIHKGLVYIDVYNYFSDLNERYLDSVARMVDRALHFDPRLAAAHYLKGQLYSLQWKTEEALNSFDRALELNPNLAGAYSGKAEAYGRKEEYVHQLENYYQNILRDRTPENLGENHGNIGFVLTNVGLREAALKSYEKMLQYEGDSTWFHFRHAQLYLYTEDFLKAIDIALPAYDNLSAEDLERNPKYAALLAVLGESCMFAGRVEESYNYLKRFLEFANSYGWTFPWFKMSIAYSFNENGQKEKARELIEIQIRQSEQWIHSHHGYSSDQYRYLAQAYMLKQDEQKALSYLRQMVRWEGSNALTAMFPLNPIFGPLKTNAEFISITDQLRTNLLKEQDQVRHWLEEHELL
jgi:TolB-like protein/tetratricopeptide (TPR) repeat protein